MSLGIIYIESILPGSYLVTFISAPQVRKLAKIYNISTYLLDTTFLDFFSQAYSLIAICYPLIVAISLMK